LFGIPTERTVLSNHAKGFMGAPSFEKAKFFALGATGEVDELNTSRAQGVVVKKLKPEKK